MVHGDHVRLVIGRDDERDDVGPTSNQCTPRTSVVGVLGERKRYDLDPLEDPSNSCREERAKAFAVVFVPPQNSTDFGFGVGMKDHAVRRRAVCS